MQRVSTVSVSRCYQVAKLCIANLGNQNGELLMISSFGSGAMESIGASQICSSHICTIFYHRNNQNFGALRAGKLYRDLAP